MRVPIQRVESWWLRRFRPFGLVARRPNLLIVRQNVNHDSLGAAVANRREHQGIGQSISGPTIQVVCCNGPSPKSKQSGFNARLMEFIYGDIHMRGEFDG